MNPQLGPEAPGSDAPTYRSSASHTDQAARITISSVDPNRTPSPTAEQIIAASPGSRLQPSKDSRRSRRGCLTCRKRKVKCDEERPVCGHCRRLRLGCNYEFIASQDSSLRAEKRRQKPFLPRRKPPNSGNRSSVVGEQSLPRPANNDVHPIRPQTVGFEGEGLHDSEATAFGNLAPSMSLDASMGNQPLHQSFTGPENWELELLGEDSLCTNIPIISNFTAAQQSTPYEYAPFSSNLARSLSSSLTDNCSPFDANLTSKNGNSVAALPFRCSEQTSSSPIDEMTLLRHFVNFAVPPILVGVEPRWHTYRDAILRLSKSSLPLRHSICAFSALSIEEPPSQRTSPAAESSDFYFTLAMNELKKLLESQSDANTQLDSREAILGSIFFLSYVGIIVSKAPKRSAELLDQAYLLLSQKTSSTSALYNQLQIWLKLLDAKVVSAGGRGFHLYSNPDSLDLNTVQGSDSPAGDGEQASMETGDILFTSLNRQAYNFYLQVLNFSCRIAHLDKWHRSRGSVDDELEVLLAADKIMRDLNALWARRPAIIDLADQEGLQQYIGSGLTTKVQHHLRTYTANFHACFIHLQRVAYPQLQSIPQIKPAVSKIVHLSRMTLEEGQSLPVSMLWPLMMAACEAEEEDTQSWIIECIEGMKVKVGNTTRTANLVREIVARQKSGQRADARTVMHEAFEGEFAII